MSGARRSTDRVPCPLGCGKTFSRQPDAARHVQEVVHNNGIDTTRYCNFPGCSWKGAKRSKRYDAHMATHNVDLEVPSDFSSTTALSSAGPPLFKGQVKVSGLAGPSNNTSYPVGPPNFPHQETPYHPVSYGGHKGNSAAGPPGWNANPDHTLEPQQRPFMWLSGAHPPMVLPYSDDPTLLSNSTSIVSQAPNSEVLEFVVESSGVIKDGDNGQIDEAFQDQHRKDDLWHK